MNIKKHIPNLFTLGNLFCGLIAIIAITRHDFDSAALFVLLGIVLDFFDGFLARLLKVQGELGKQLDSLADMVTSGVVPGLVLFAMLQQMTMIGYEGDVTMLEVYECLGDGDSLLPYVGFIVTLAACYRLGKFNIDTRQSESFIGLPTPAMTLFVVSLPVILFNTDIMLLRRILINDYFIITVVILMSVLMNVNLPLLSLKFKSFGLKENLFKYLLIFISILLIVTLKYIAVPLIIIVYVLLSIINNMIPKKV